jgi:hypothetical protein
MNLKLSKIHSTLGALGGIFLAFFLLKNPTFILYLLVIGLPGFLLTYSFSKEEFSFLERLALSLPISNIFLIIFRGLTTLNIPFNGWLIWGIAIALPIALSLPNLGFFLSKLKRFSSEKKIEVSRLGQTIFVIALAVLLCSIFWGSLLQDSKLPLTDQVVNQAFIVSYNRSITESSRFPYWSSEYSGGFPLVVFDSPFYYERNAIDWILMGQFNATHHMNYYGFYCLALLLIGIYCLARRLGWGKLASLFAMALFISSPLLGSKLGYSGDMKEMTSFVIFPVLALTALLMLEKKELRYYILFGVLFASYYFTDLVPLIPSLMTLGIFFVLYKAFNRERLEKKEILGIAALGICILLLTGYHMLSLVVSMKYGTPGTWNLNLNLDSFIREVVKPMFTNPLANQYTINMGLFFGIAAVAGMAISLFRLRKKENYFLLGFWLMLLCYILPVVRIALQHVETHRLVLLILMVFALFIGRIFDNANKWVKIGAVVLVVALLGLNGPLARTQANNWVGEQAQNGLFSQEYSYLDSLGPGRVINYGIFAYATEPFIPALSKSLWMITHTTGVGARTMPQYEFKDGSESALNMDHNLTYIVNRMRTTFTRYVIIIKDPSRKGDITHALLNGYLTTNLNTTPLYDSDQLSMLLIPDSYYIQSVIPASTNLSKEEIYSDFDGWKFFGFAQPQKPEDYGMSIGMVAGLRNLPYPKVYNYKINYQGDMDVYGNFSGEWIVVKDHYFPTWRAEMNGKQLRIEESNLGTLLIKTEPGSKIHLYHEPYWFERPLSAAAIIFILVCFVLVSYSDRFERRYLKKKEI